MKSVYDYIRRGLTGREHIRVVVLGTKESGKTVFLTALENHLRNYDKSRMSVYPWSIENIYSDGLNRGDILPFKYAEARDQLSRGEWPDNTRALSVIRLKLRLEKPKPKTKKGMVRMARRTVIFEVLDLPGERVADLSMVGRSFREWCEWLEDRYTGADGNCPHFRRYVESIKLMNDSDAILRAYKDCVYQQYVDGILTVTPSILKLNADDKFLVGESASDYRENLANTYIGMAKDSQFAPLSRDFLNDKSAQHLAIVKAFQKAYGKYKSSIVDPINKWLSHANKAVYLVDVLSLLRNGPKEYNAQQKFANEALRLFRNTYSDSPVIGGIQRFIGAFIRTHVDGVYVVATKSDLVVGEKNRIRMKELAKEMIKPVFSGMGLASNQKMVTSCASVLTTEEFGKENSLRARVQVGKDKFGKAKVEMMTYEVNDVPIGWPKDKDWQRGDKEYNFRPTFPVIDKQSDVPPQHLGMDNIVRLLLSLT